MSTSLKSKTPVRQHIWWITVHKWILYQLQYATHKLVESFCDKTKKIKSMKYQNFTYVDDISIEYENQELGNNLYQCKISLWNTITEIKPVIIDFINQYLYDKFNKLNRQYIICTEENLPLLKRILDKNSYDFDGQIDAYLNNKKENDFLKTLKESINQFITELREELLLKKNVTLEYTKKSQRGITDNKDIQNNKDIYIELIENFSIKNFFDLIKIDMYGLEALRSTAISMINSKFDMDKWVILYGYIFDTIAQNYGKNLNISDIEEKFILFWTILCDIKK